MPVFNGTDGNDTIIGTDGDDIFYTSRGQGILSGLTGFDSFNADFSAALNAYGDFPGSGSK